ncbi:unnamed protein product [Protopolystoma xenopodis]|uniref:Uncharacterized protein n=1 Tax=Protopolystoma xenopodis TaxID=117903 RepID=A0A3S5CCM2_9PLAT|nr:unnamed protein product [Protopolystoma xenopodis]
MLERLLVLFDEGWQSIKAAVETVGSELAEPMAETGHEVGWSQTCRFAYFCVSAPKRKNQPASPLNSNHPPSLSSCSLSFLLSQCRRVDFSVHPLKLCLTIQTRRTALSHHTTIRPYLVHSNRRLDVSQPAAWPTEMRTGEHLNYDFRRLEHMTLAKRGRRSRSLLMILRPCHNCSPTHSNHRPVKLEHAEEEI